MVEKMTSSLAKATYVIVGNGIAGVTAAEILRQEDSDAHIVVIADDPFPVYYRPALKDYLGGRVREDKLWARPTSFYQDHSIHFVKDRVMSIQPGQHTLQLQSGRQGQYTRLLLASGARAATLNCPGIGLDGVTTLRTVADYQAVLQRLPLVRRIAISGSGTLALETVETLRHRGYQVSHLVRRRTLWSDVLDATASDLVLQQERRDGVDVLLEEEIAEIYGSQQGEVQGIVTTSGQQIDCEMVLIAIGVDPIIDYVQGSGIGGSRGVRVDAKMRTSAPDIYAAGDILETSDPLTRRTRIIGQWYPAIQQARAAAYSMLDLLDADQPFNSSTFYNATFLYGLGFASVGLTNTPGFQELAAEPKPRIYRKVLLRDGVPVGALALGDRKQVLAFKRAIDHSVNLAPVASRLFADDFNLQAWLDKQGVPPPFLGVNREGDAATKQAAYAGVQPNRTNTLKPSTSEAHLVPLENNTTLELPELRLSQTNVLTVGRQVGVHLLIDEGTVSRRHAELRYANGQYVLHDLGSTNGTYVNGERLAAHSAHVLKADDEVRFGKVIRFAFVLRTVSGEAKRTSPGAMTMVGVTRLQDLSLKTAPLSQPVLNADGSLQLPESEKVVPASIVAKFKDQPVLIVLKGTSEKGQLPLVYQVRMGKRISLGRDKENDIDLEDIVISRQHAEIFPGPDGFYIRDLQSSNGVIVNQTKIDNPYHLSHGDRIVLGSSLLYFIDLHTNTTQRLSDRPRPVAISAESSKQPALTVGRVASVPKKGASGVRGPQLPLNTLNNLKICARCGTSNILSARFCASCSAPLS